MSALGTWVGRGIERWLSGFKSRHGLDIPAATDGVVTGVPTGPVLLHVACGFSTLDHIPIPGFQQGDWQELRLDADASVRPDIEGTMTNMTSVASGFADAIFSSHGIEHLYWHDVPKAFAEFRRVLKDDGFAVITCPDVQAAAAMIAEDRMFDTAYESPAGTITPFDILYSYRPFVEENPQWMSHHCGFTLSTLTQKLRESGFAAVAGFRRPGAFDLWVVASKSPRSEDAMRALAKDFLVSP